ncbi:MAG TPA: bifunctional indole-3-glycerol phosphate synthase/phosphoribosylanthranilate isomerase [Treponema sp.]|nr:bifunctional indole-3-glycerol phosphate synthase/phosphoribosylanthranilate isomerase [Treponema sp.]
MAANILDEIVKKRREDISRLGFEFGVAVPEKRMRGKPVPFLPEKGAVLEVKRASPSKGDIAPNLDASSTAFTYAAAGASAISVLTEMNYFHGSLADLIAVGKAVDSYTAEHPESSVAVLRKDFLLDAGEVDVAYRAGADAVLLISRILTEDEMIRMAKRCEEYGMTAFIELRLSEDVKKLASVCAEVDKRFVVAGVNARDLATFRIDMLIPCGMLNEIKETCGNDMRVVFESGIRTPGAAGFAGSLGFTGMLLGEAAAKNPAMAKDLVTSFKDSAVNQNAKKWLELATRLREKKEGKKNCAHHANDRTRPLLKICGLTNVEDALSATLMDPDFLGFVFSKGSPRCASSDVVLRVKSILDEQFNTTCQDEHIFAAGEDDLAPMLVGVVTDLESEEGKTALSLVKKNKLDFLQLHGKKAVEQFFADRENLNLPHYAVVNVESPSDVDEVARLCESGEPRVLIDAKKGAVLGGTGCSVSSENVLSVSRKLPLWLAGGINPETVSSIINSYSPEMIDVASGVESEPGKKDYDRLLALDNAISSAVSCR